MLLSIDVEFCSDDHLIDIFDQSAGWKTYDARGRDLYTTATLRAEIIDEAARLAVLHEAVTIQRVPNDGVVVTGEQIRRLMDGMPTTKGQSIRLSVSGQDSAA